MSLQRIIFDLSPWIVNPMEGRTRIIENLNSYLCEEQQDLARTYSNLSREKSR